MIKCFFNVAGEAEDEIGSEYPSLKAARAAAVSLLGAYLARNPAYLDEGHWRIDVVSGDRELLFKVVVAVVDAPAAGTLLPRPD